MGHGWRSKTDDGDADAAPHEQGVGFEVGLSRLVVHGICTEDGKVAVVDKHVEHLMTCFDVVIADHAHVVPDEVAHIGHFVPFAPPDEIEIVARRFALEDVASIDEDGGTAEPLHLLGNVGMNTLHAPLAPSCVSEVVGEVVAVDVGGEDDVDLAGVHVCHLMF